ncbi:MAG: GNAT family N-acetyltransferase [Hyphomicrobiaceae bacterium]|nr:GNAT family N-acetyltransferase [Hyphomicrobiaceae bacterium]
MDTSILHTIAIGSVAARLGTAPTFAPETAFDIEPAGTSLQRAAQRRIHAGRADLRAIEGVTSFGRSVAAFVPELSADAFAGIVRDYRRVLLMGRDDEIAAVAETTREMGTDISGPMPVIGVNVDQFFAPAAAEMARIEGELRLKLSTLAADATEAEILEVQDLQQAVHLTPLPGAFLRGYHGPVSTVLVRDADGRLVASATTVGLGDVGPGFTDTAMLVGVSVSPDAQGRSIGRALTAAALIEANRALGADRVAACVSPTNTRAFRTNARFGMVPLAGISALYVELPETA